MRITGSRLAFTFPVEMRACMRIPATRYHAEFRGRTAPVSSRRRRSQRACLHFQRDKAVAVARLTPMRRGNAKLDCGDRSGRTSRRTSRELKAATVHIILSRGSCRGVKTAQEKFQYSCVKLFGVIIH